MKILTKSVMQCYFYTIENTDKDRIAYKILGVNDSYNSFKCLLLTFIWLAYFVEAEMQIHG